VLHVCRTRRAQPSRQQRASNNAASQGQVGISCGVPVQTTSASSVSVSRFSKPCWGVCLHQTLIVHKTTMAVLLLLIHACR